MLTMNRVMSGKAPTWELALETKGTCRVFVGRFWECFIPTNLLFVLFGW